MRRVAQETRTADVGLLPKIRIRKRRGSWYVFIAGDIPEMPCYNEFAEALDAALYAYYRWSQPDESIAAREDR